MEFDSQQLRALAAIAAAGSLDGAATALRLTPSAVSQRLRALERAAGQVLVVRSRPAALTAAGEVLLRLATQVALLEQEAGRELTGARAEEGRARLAVAVNADSLATWFLPAVAPLADAIELRVRREDETQTSELLRRGAVLAAVTTETAPAAGCVASALGAMRYVPVAAPAFAERWFGSGGGARDGAGADRDLAERFRAAPVVCFDDADELQERFLRQRTGAGISAPRHLVPASADYLRAIELGFGWGLIPELQLGKRVADGALAVLDRQRLDVPLQWQRWSLATASLTRLTETVLAAGRAALRQPG